MTNREVLRLVHELEEQGWEVAWRRSGHLKATSPTGQVYFFAATPSSYRSVRNMTADLRRMGARL